MFHMKKRRYFTGTDILPNEIKNCRSSNRNCLRILHFVETLTEDFNLGSRLAPVVILLVFCLHVS